MEEKIVESGRERSIADISDFGHACICNGLLQVRSVYGYLQGDGNILVGRIKKEKKVHWIRWEKMTEVKGEEVGLQRFAGI